MLDKQRFLQRYKARQSYYLYQFKDFIVKNWQKLTLLLLIIVVFSSKDLTIHFNLTSPFGKNNNEISKDSEGLFSNENQAGLHQGFSEKIKQDSRRETFSLFPIFFGDTGKNNKAKTLKDIYSDIKKSKKEAFIKQFSNVAIEEMNQFGIPASITLAQALLHGQAGTGALATQNNNHFSITCGSSWTDKSRDIQGVCYRSYNSAWQSFRDHSKLITSGRFEALKKFSSTDYKQWAKGLQSKGYSTDDTYAELLIKIIKEQNLDRFDE